jgi:hypothetical protein
MFLMYSTLNICGTGQDIRTIFGMRLVQTFRQLTTKFQKISLEKGHLITFVSWAPIFFNNSAQIEDISNIFHSNLVYVLPCVPAKFHRDSLKNGS